MEVVKCGVGGPGFQVDDAGAIADGNYSRLIEVVRACENIDLATS